MMQRIQSVLILLYLACIFVLLSKNIVEITSEQTTFSLNAWFLSTTINSSVEIIVFPYVLAGIAQTVALFCGILVFINYNNRTKQLRLLNFSIYFLIVEYLLVAYLVIKSCCISGDTQCFHFSVGAGFLVVSPMLLFCAKYFVKKDRLMIHSANKFI